MRLSIDLVIAMLAITTTAAPLLGQHTTETSPGPRRPFRAPIPPASPSLLQPRAEEAAAKPPTTPSTETPPGPRRPLRGGLPPGFVNLDVYAPGVGKGMERKKEEGRKERRMEREPYWVDGMVVVQGGRDGDGEAEAERKAEGMVARVDGEAEAEGNGERMGWGREMGRGGVV